MDSDAEAFLDSLYSWHRSRYRALQRLLQLSFLQPILWWTFFVAERPLTHIPGKLCVSFLFPPLIPLAFVLWLGKRHFFSKYEADHAERRLEVVEGNFTKSVFQTGPKMIMSVSVNGQKVLLPIRFYKQLPESGSARFAVFPNCRFCWTMDDQGVWKQGDYKFW